jgi:hypothetical protein
MKPFKKFLEEELLSEGSTEAAKEMEFLLVDAGGGNSGKSGYKNLDAVVKKEKKFKSSMEMGKHILKKSKIKKGNTSNTRMSVSSSINSGTYEDGTPMWQGGNKTPKTDIILSGNKISLKKGSSQLMSGGSAESLSTYEVAWRNTPEFNKKLNKLADEVERGLEELMPSREGMFKGGVSTQKKGGTVYQDTKGQKGKIADVKAGSFDKDKILAAADKHNLVMKKKMDELFKGSIEFKKEFVFEAMTGKVKFEDGEGTATHFLVVDFDGSSDYHKVLQSSDKYVSSILSKVRPDVKFKTSAIKKKIDGKNQKTGHYKFWSTVGLMYNAAVKETNEACEMAEKEYELMTEGYVDRVAQYFKNAWDKFKNWLSEMLIKVRQYITSSVKSLIEFLDLEPVINHKNVISW